MANDINMVVLVGRLTRDAELRYTNSGIAVCKFSLAVNRRKRSGDNWEEEVSFIDIVVWGKQGEAISRYLEKGKQVSVAGELRQSRWEQDGQSRNKIEVIANNVQLLGGASGSGKFSQNRKENETDAPAQNMQNRNTDNGLSTNGPEQFDDDIPF
ncbi:MAG: single-stranded DNA-binding protein [Spirochaetales bacterium]|nr:single-stranded DNA-binding protein [Spirochaetales bacterium]